jgi:hypothetical protein
MGTVVEDVPVQAPVFGEGMVFTEKFAKPAR